MTILTLHKSVPANDVPATLRRIADDIEAGEVEWPVTTAVLLLGHTGNERPSDAGLWEEVHWSTYGFGPRADCFTVRGLMATAMNRWGHDD